MATDSAELAPTRLAPDPTRNAWQVPLFLVGVAVFVSAWQGWLPLGTPDPAADFARDLVAIRIAYEKVAPDREELKQLLSKATDRVGKFPEHGTTARFTLGSGYVRLAELTSAPDEARAYWMSAKLFFEQVNAAELKDPDPPRLAFRFAKARVALGLPPGTTDEVTRLQMFLLGNVPFGEVAGDAGRLQAELAMKLNPPDLATAREALTRYVTTTGIATPAASLSRARYLLGEIHLRRGEPDLARKWLEQVGTDAPEVAAAARFTLAKVRIRDQDYLGAIRDLDAVRSLPDAPPAIKLAAAYHLGLCRTSTNEFDAALKAFEEAVKAAPPEGTAAAVRLAELYLKSSDPARRAAAVELLAGAVKGVNEPKQFYVNSGLRANEAVAAFELAHTTLLNDGAFEPAVRAAEASRVLVAAGRDREKRAEALAAWAASLQKSNGDYKSKAAAAAEDYASLVALQADPAPKAALLQRAAALHKLAGNTEAAVAALQEAVKLPRLPEAAAGPVWADLADALILTGRPEKEVVNAFNEAMKSAGVAGTATRYRLAMQFSDSKRAELVPLARELFQQIAQQDPAPEEREFHERALVELAHAHIRGRNFPEAEVWLRKQLGFYATGAEAPLGRLLLGVCLVQRSDVKPPSGPDPAAAARLRDEALKLFKQIVAEADAKLRRDGKLGERDAWLRLQAALRVLQVYQQLNRPNDLLAEADQLRDRHRGTVEELIIMSLMYHAFNQKNERGRALQMRDNMKELFDRLSPSAFTQQSGEYSRRYWETTWFTPEPK